MRNAAYFWITTSSTKRHSPDIFRRLAVSALGQPRDAGTGGIHPVRGRKKYLECDYGLAACEPGKSDRQCRWDYPNGWAPLQLIAIEAFDRNGFTEAARRLAQKYVDLVTANFEKTGELWEKYNVADGTVDIRGAHPMPAMMGWSRRRVRLRRRLSQPFPVTDQKSVPAAGCNAAGTASRSEIDR